MMSLQLKILFRVQALPNHESNWKTLWGGCGIQHSPLPLAIEGVNVRSGGSISDQGLMYL